MPSATIRFALEAAFLILVALGAGRTRLEPAVIVALTVALILVAVVERGAPQTESAAAQ